MEGEGNDLKYFIHIQTYSNRVYPYRHYGVCRTQGGTPARHVVYLSLQGGMDIASFVHLHGS